MNTKVIISLVVVALLVISVGYYEYSSYEQTAVQTTVVTGKITNIMSSAAGPGGLALPGAVAPPGAAPPGAAPQAPAVKTTTSNAGVSIVTISVGSGNFSTLFQCSPVRGYSVGQTVKVADQLLRSGQHSYAPDVACPGTPSPFQSLHLAQTTASFTT